MTLYTSKGEKSALTKQLLTTQTELFWDSPSLFIVLVCILPRQKYLALTKRYFFTYLRFYSQVNNAALMSSRLPNRWETGMIGPKRKTDKSKQTRKQSTLPAPVAYTTNTFPTYIQLYRNPWHCSLFSTVPPPTAAPLINCERFRKTES